MRVLSVASEVFPLVKTGGLADVAGALPPALGRHGIEVRTLLPGYPAVMAPDRSGARAARLAGAARRRRRGCVAATVEGLELIVLDAPAPLRPAGQALPDRDGRD